MYDLASPTPPRSPETPTACDIVTPFHVAVGAAHPVKKSFRIETNATIMTFDPEIELSAAVATLGTPTGLVALELRRKDQAILLLYQSLSFALVLCQGIKQLHVCVKIES